MNFIANPAIGVLSVNYVNEENTNCRFNYTFNITRDVTSIMAYMTFRVTEFDGDTDYKKEVYKTTFNLSKVLKGITGHLMTRALMENVQKSLNVELKFPIRKVSRIIWSM